MGGWRGAGSIERWSSSLPTSRLSPSRAQFPEKVGLGLRASYHSSEPPGAPRGRTLFISISERTVPPRGGLQSSPGLSSAQRGLQVSPRVSSQSRLPGFGLSARLCLIPQGLCGSGEGWAGGPGVLFDSQQGLVLGSQHSPIAPAPLLCADCLCSSHPIDGNNFLPAPRGSGRACSLPWGCFSLSLSLSFGFGCGDPSLPLPIPHGSISHPVPPLWTGSLAF